MESLPKNEVLDYHPDTLHNVRKLFGLEDPRRMEEAIDILQEWARKQEHFTCKEFDRNILERIIVINKGLLERSKMRLDRMCTVRTLMPEIYHTRIGVTNLNTIEDAVLPTLTPENYRVIFTKNYGTAYGSKTLMDYYIRQIRLWQYLFRHDYNAGFIIIYDLTQADIMELVKSINVSDIKKFLTAVTEGYGARIRALYTISNSKFINSLFDMVKPLLPTKIANRLEVAYNIKDLKSKIPLDILPSDYGGKAKSFRDLCADTVSALSTDDHLVFLKKMSEYKTDESKRQVDKFNEDYLGMPGTFRTLNVD